MENQGRIDIKVRLSTLWIVIMMNLIFADVLSVMVELVNKGTLAIPGDVKITMAIAALFTNIPILMIYLSRVLPYKSNRIANIIAAILSIIYVVAGGSFSPHYIIAAVIEVLLLIIIIVYSWKWNVPEK